MISRRLDLRHTIKSFTNQSDLLESKIHLACFGECLCPGAEHDAVLGHDHLVIDAGDAILVQLDAGLLELEAAAAVLVTVRLVLRRHHAGSGEDVVLVAAAAAAAAIRRSRAGPSFFVLS